MLVLQSSRSRRYRREARLELFPAQEKMGYTLRC